jgi:hypothetical protein
VQEGDVACRFGHFRTVVEVCRFAEWWIVCGA